MAREKFIYGSSYLGEKSYPWYLLTNFNDLDEVIKAYKKRVGIEAMFKDCKTGGYNLEGAKARNGKLIKACGQGKYSIS